MTARTRAGAVAAALALVLVVAGCSSSGHSATSPAPSGLLAEPAGHGYDGFGIDPPRPRPNFALTDRAGTSFDFGAATKGHPTLLYFGYTRCPDICPATMADIGVALKALPAALQRSTYVVFVSTDVRHDTAPVIAQWLANFSPGTQATWVGLHGTLGQVQAAEASAHIFLANDAGQNHSTQVLLYGPDNYARDSFVYNNNGESKQIEHDLPMVARG